MVLVQELERHRQDALGELVGRQGAELAAEGLDGDHGLGHGAVAAGVADVGEVLPHELAGVARVAEIPHRHHERVADEAGDDRPLDVFDLQVEVGHVRDEVLARHGPEEGAEDLLLDAALLARQIT